MFISVLFDFPLRPRNNFALYAKPRICDGLFYFIPARRSPPATNLIETGPHFVVDAPFGKTEDDKSDKFISFLDLV